MMKYREAKKIVFMKMKFGDGPRCNKDSEDIRNTNNSHKINRFSLQICISEKQDKKLDIYS